MSSFPIPDNEEQRLVALQRYAVLDSEPDSSFDDITQLAGQICGTPIALVSLVDERRQWFKSRVGFETDATLREHAFCAHAIMQADVFEVENALEDERFRDNPMVVSDPYVRFYAGAPLTTNDGHRLGTLCVLDRQPRLLEPWQRSALESLGRQVMALLELRQTTAALARQLLDAASLRAAEAELEQRTRTEGDLSHTRVAQISHELRSPLTAIIGVSELMAIHARKRRDTQTQAQLQTISDASSHMLQVLNGLVELGRLEHGALTIRRSEVDIAKFAAELARIARPLALVNGNRLRVHCAPDTGEVSIDATKLRQIALNLITNACKFTESGSVTVSLARYQRPGGEYLWLQVTDTGEGIASERLDEIFAEFQQLPTTIEQKLPGSGLGLSLTRRLCDALNGTIEVDSAPGQGSTFTVTLPL